MHAALCRSGLVDAHNAGGACAADAALPAVAVVQRAHALQAVAHVAAGDASHGSWRIHTHLQ